MTIKTKQRIMNASYEIGQGSDVTSSYNLTVRAFEQIKERAYSAKYPQFRWNKTIELGSIDGDINIGARTASYKIEDESGMGAFVNGAGTNIPTVEMGLDKASVPILLASISSVVTIDDARKMQYGYSINSITKKGEIMRKGSERHIERVFFFGDGDLGFESYINYSQTPVTVAAIKAAGGTEWTNATSDEIVADINNAITSIFVVTRENGLANVVELPTEKWALISTKRIGDSVNHLVPTVLEYVRLNNVYTASTGEPLEIKSLPYLSGAGAGGTDRMIAKVKSVDNDWLPMPELFNVLPPQQSELSTKLYSTYTFGSYHNRYPLESIFMDGI